VDTPRFLLESGFDLISGAQIRTAIKGKHCKRSQSPENRGFDVEPKNIGCGTPKSSILIGFF